MDPNIREATLDDLEDILDGADAAWYAAYGGILDPSTIAAALEEYYDPEIIQTAIEHEAIVFDVAVVDEAVVGFASAEQTWADEVELHTLYVHPDRWGAGIGSALVDRVAVWARNQGVDRLACGVLVENVVAVDFFEAIGFRRGRETEAEIAGEIHSEYELELEL